MLTRKLQPRRDRNKMASKRRQSLHMSGIFDRFTVFKAMIYFDFKRRKMVRWWGINKFNNRKWESRNGN